jgi:hypothetical protein
MVGSIARLASGVNHGFAVWRKAGTDFVLRSLGYCSDAVVSQVENVKITATLSYGIEHEEIPLR